MEQSRLLIQDNQNNLFRILKFGTGIDKYDEPYVKISFPYMKGVSRLFNVDKKGEVKDGYMEEFDYVEEERINEFTYHYVSGVSHFKSVSGHTSQVKGQATLDADTPLKLMAVLVFDLNSVPNFKKVKATNDFLLPNKFNESSGRIIDLYVSKPHESPKLVDKSNINYFNQYEFIDHDLNVKLSIIDYEFKMKPAYTGIAIHRPYDPQDSFLENSTHNPAIK